MEPNEWLAVARSLERRRVWTEVVQARFIYDNHGPGHTLRHGTYVKETQYVGEYLYSIPRKPMYLDLSYVTRPADRVAFRSGRLKSAFEE